MDRIDSGFGGSYCLKAPEKEQPSVHRSNTAPTRQRKSKKTAPEPLPTHISMSATTHRPISEKRHGEPRRSMEPRRRSIASSSDNSAKSRNRGHSSKQSSRKTSCTLIDPSRPTRHYRIKSSQTVPTTNRDIDDVLALHFRSCSLFSNPSYHSSNLKDNASGMATVHDVPAPASPTTDDIHLIPNLPSAQHSENTVATIKADAIHWTSPTTRRREYEKIDRANSGIRGFMRKIIPRCVSGPPPPRFYEKDMSDVGSVRRYRLSLDEEVDEKNTSLVRQKSRRLERAQTGVTSTKRWGCF